MKRCLLLCSLPLSILVSSCNDSSDNYSSEKQTIRFVELAHGVAKKSSDNSISSSDSYSDESSSNDLGIAEDSDTIPARIGTRFGVRYMLESNLDPDVELRQVWIFPDSMHNEEGDAYVEDAYKVSKTPNQETYASYQLEYPYELIKGKWQLCFYYKKHLLYRKIFVLI